jgi:hypothetical protein
MKMDRLMGTNLTFYVAWCRKPKSYFPCYYLHFVTLPSSSSHVVSLMSVASIKASRSQIVQSQLVYMYVHDVLT